jgi:hypothetical protein
MRQSHPALRTSKSASRIPVPQPVNARSRNANRFPPKRNPIPDNDNPFPAYDNESQASFPDIGLRFPAFAV